MTQRIYLAGPDVFHRNAAEIGRHKCKLCRDHGFTGLYPLIASHIDAQGIFRSCLSLMREADFGLFNLTPFRGPSADVGTVFELGYMVADGKPVFAYSNAAGDLLERLKADPGLAFDDASASWRDQDGMLAEAFGNADNLMLDAALAGQGRAIHRRAVPHAARYDDLGGFIACLDEIRSYVGDRGRP